MACLVANFLTLLDVFTSVKGWTKPKSSFCSTIPYFENLKCFGALETKIGFEITLCIIASLASGLRNRASWSEIICSMHYATLLMALLHRVCRDSIEFCVSFDCCSNVFHATLWHYSCERCCRSWSNWVLSSTLSLKVIILPRGSSLDCPNRLSFSLVLPMKIGSIKH
jgi:hypothetical protein